MSPFHSTQVPTKLQRRSSERSTKSDRKDKAKETKLSKDKLKGAKKGKRDVKEKGKKGRKEKEKVIDDTQSEVSYGQPDTDLSKSKASKKAFGSKSPLLSHPPLLSTFHSTSVSIPFPPQPGPRSRPYSTL